VVDRRRPRRRLQGRAPGAARLPLARFWTLPFALCGITIVEIRNGRPRLRLHNATDHLTGVDGTDTAEARARDAERRRSGAL
jgi:hypothetical protein